MSPAACDLLQFADLVREWGAAHGGKATATLTWDGLTGMYLLHVRAGRAAAGAMDSRATCALVSLATKLAADLAEVRHGAA